MRCHACGAENTAPSEFFGSFVSSDCKPVYASLELFQCCQCGIVQKYISQGWQESCDEIYTAYEIYHQGSGKEQGVKPADGSAMVRRSNLLVELIASRYVEGDAPAVLDIGCGNGAFLRAWNEAMPQAVLCGAELNRDFAPDIEAISARSSFMTLDKLSDTDAQFDVVSLVHCLEHIPGPIDYLSGARRLLKPGGVLFIQVPDAQVNPFDLLIADHASHFSKASLNRVISKAGFEIDQAGNLVLDKEISAIARPVLEAASLGQDATADNPQSLKRSLDWLREALDLGREVASNKTFGIFGTSIAATWFLEELKGQVAFLVDEDPQRIGREIGGVGIFGPDDIPQGASVLFALEPKLGRQLAARHDDKNFKAHVLPHTMADGEGEQ